MKKYIILLFLYFNISGIYSGDYSNFVNLKIGNVFIFTCHESKAIPPNTNCSAYFLMRIIITDTLWQSGKKYFHFTRDILQLSGTGTCNLATFMFPFNFNNFNMLRLDTVNGMFYSYEPTGNCTYIPNEVLMDSLNVKLYDVVSFRCINPQYSYYCVDTVGKREFYGYTNGTLRRKYERGIGLISNSQVMSVGPGTIVHEQILRGRVINGIVFGDTTFPITVGLSETNSEIPENFSISQNYPNPFNPVTKIKFAISGTSVAQTFLSVYDLLGREVAVLVNQQLQPGTYEVDFDGSNLPNGVYYYKLESGSFTETKKMVLLK